ncbi:MFS transporter [Gordonia terrae]
MSGRIRNCAQRHGLAIFLACAAQFLSALNMGIGPLMIPQMASDLGFGPIAQAWVVSGYALAFAGFVLIGGRLADVFGGGWVLLVGYALASTSAAVAALSHTTVFLIGARIGQGAGAALTVPAALTIIVTARSGSSDRSRMLALFAGAGGVGFGVGMAVGGLASDTVGWRPMFAAVAVLSALLAALTLVLIDGRPRSSVRLGIWPGVCAAAGLLLLAYAVTVGASSEGLGRSTVIAVAAGGLLFAIFVVSQAQSTDPIMPLSLWTRPGFTVSIIAATLAYAAWVSCYYFSALSLQQVLGLSGTAAACVMAPIGFGAALGSHLAARVLPRASSPRLLIVAGAVLYAMAIALLAVPGLQNPWSVVLVLAVVVGGHTAAYVGLNTVAFSAGDVGEYGVIGSIFNASSQIGGGLAVALLAVVAVSVAGGDPELGYRATFLVASGLALASGAVIACTRLPKTRATAATPLSRSG